MCSPLAAAAAAFTTVGTIMDNNARNAASRRGEEEMAALQAAETARQNRFQADARAAWQKGLNKNDYNNTMTELGAKETKRKTAYTGGIKDYDANTDALSGQQDAPRVVKENAASKIADRNDMTRKEGNARAILDAWGDQNLDQATVNAINSGTINMNAGFSRNSSQINEMEMAEARARAMREASKGSGLGSIFKMVGSGLSLAGGAGGFGNIINGPGMIGDFFNPGTVGTQIDAAKAWGPYYAGNGGGRFIPLI